MSNKENVKIISARPEDADFIAWIVAQGMHMDGVPSAHFVSVCRNQQSSFYFSRYTILVRFYLSTSSNMSSLLSHALMLSPATVSFTLYHFPVSMLPERVANCFLPSPLICSMACIVLPS